MNTSFSPVIIAQHTYLKVQILLGAWLFLLLLSFLIKQCVFNRVPQGGASLLWS